MFCSIFCQARLRYLVKKSLRFSDSQDVKNIFVKKGAKFGKNNDPVTELTKFF